MPERCPRCHGTGEVPKKCPRCAGHGEVFSTKVGNLVACPECDGKGREPTEDEINVENILVKIRGKK